MGPIRDVSRDAAVVYKQKFIKSESLEVKQTTNETNRSKQRY